MKRQTKSLNKLMFSKRLGICCLAVSALASNATSHSYLAGRYGEPIGVVPSPPGDFCTYLVPNTGDFGCNCAKGTKGGTKGGKVGCIISDKYFDKLVPEGINNCIIHGGSNSTITCPKDTSKPSVVTLRCQDGNVGWQTDSSGMVYCVIY